MINTTPKSISTDDIRNGNYASADFAPKVWEIPESFRRVAVPWTGVASDMMWLGSGVVLRAEPKVGINRDQALLHVGAVLHAIDMSVEDRELAAGYLLSEWFDHIETSAGSAAGVGCGERNSANQMEFLQGS